MQTLSIVTSAKNESENIFKLYSEIKIALASENYEWKLFICDNGSTDDTWDRIKQLTIENPNVIGIQMTRDFGFEASIFAAIQKTNSDATIMMASDLQDPPAEIPKLLREYEKGYDHVFQVVTKRPDSSLLRNANSKVFYFIANKLSGGLIEVNSSIFRLISRQVTDDLKMLTETNRFMRALVPWLGHKSKGIPIERASRFHGNSKSFSRGAFRYALKGILSNSYRLLDYVGVLGLFVFFTSIFTLCAFLIIWVNIGVPFAGYGIIISAVVGGFGLVFLCLGIMAQYISLIYEEVKNRPNYVIKRIVGDK
jgi:dolichol-phosphate mannosyltransferase